MSRLFLVVVCLTTAAAAFAQEPKVSTDRLAERVYLFTHNNHRSLFGVSDGGADDSDDKKRQVSTADRHWRMWHHVG
jgi:hypothetical protein